MIAVSVQLFSFLNNNEQMTNELLKRARSWLMTMFDVFVLEFFSRWKTLVLYRDARRA